MDPQTCLQRIFDAMRDNNKTDFNAAFADLANWLNRGGFAPKLTTMGKQKVTVGTMGEFKMMPRTTVTSADKRYTIHTVNTSERVECPADGYEFVIWATKQRFPFPTA